MRAHYHKMKNNPFNPVKDRRSKAQVRSIESKDQIENIITVQRLPSEDRIMTKYRNKSFAKARDSSANLDIGANLSFKDLGKQLKSKRTLVQENEQLKKKLETMIQNKTSRRGSTNKKLSTEFQKEIYWNGSQSYMISGIKLQYQKMKDSFIKKSEDYEDLMRSAIVANNMEFLTYIETLQIENHILARQLDGGQKRQKLALDDQSMVQLQLRERIALYEDSVNSQKQKNRKKGVQITKLKNKIAFLEKLVITKDNNEHLAIRKMKKLEKQQSELHHKISELEEQIHLMGKDHQAQVARIESFHKQNLQLQLNKQASSSKEQQDNINRLMRENRYLQNLIDSWKAEKNPSKDNRHSKDTQENHSHSNHHHIHHSASNKSRIEKDLFPLSHSQIVTEKNPLKRSQIHKETQKSHQDTFLKNKESDSQQQVPMRQPYSADHKNSDKAVKNRRVQAYEIQEIVQFSRYRQIGRQHNIQWIISRFQSKEGTPMEKQYISMAEARQTLQDQLQISPSEAHLLARYLIEHSNLEFVYTDDLNEYSRSVVKSIIRSLYGNYSIYTNEKAQFLQMLQNYRAKLQWLLESTTKGGIVTRDKFNDLLQSLSINCKSGFDTFCISRMAINSQKLQRLQHKYLFQDLLLND